MVTFWPSGDKLRLFLYDCSVLSSVTQKPSFRDLSHYGRSTPSREFRLSLPPAQIVSGGCEWPWISRCQMELSERTKHRGAPTFLSISISKDTYKTIDPSTVHLNPASGIRYT